nr:hypothetical protein [uncultured Cetobacterium sp.]
MKKILLVVFLILGIRSFSEEIQDNRSQFKGEYRLIGSFFTRHASNNDVYNNDTNLIGFEYRPIKDVGISFGYFENSFYNDSYLLSVGKYFRPIESNQNFYFTLGAGVVKGYEKINVIQDKNTGEVLKKSKFDTNIGKDYIIAGSVGMGYDITERISVNVMYVGAFVGVLTLKLS